MNCARRARVRPGPSGGCWRDAQRLLVRSSGAPPCISTGLDQPVHAHLHAVSFKRWR